MNASHDWKLKLGVLLLIFRNFQNCCAKYLKDNNHHSLHLVQKYAWLCMYKGKLYIICPSKLTIFIEHKQISRHILHQAEAIVYVSRACNFKCIIWKLLLVFPEDVVQGSPFPTQHKSLSAYPKGSPLTTPGGGGLLCKSLGRGVPMKPLPYTRPWSAWYYSPIVD